MDHRNRLPQPSRPVIRRAVHVVFGPLALAPVFAVALAGAFLLRFETTFNQQRYDELLRHLPFVVAVKVGLFAAFRVSRAWHAFVSFPELIRLAKATLGSAAAVALVGHLADPAGMLPRSVLVIDTCLTGLLVGGCLCLRRGLRERRERLPFSRQSVPVLIVGLNATGEALLRTIRCGTGPAYHPVGIVASQPGLMGREIGGVRVVGVTSRAAEIAQRTGAKTVLVVAGELSGRQIRKLVDGCRPRGVEVRVLPSVEQLLGGHLDFQPRQVAIEDLLGREPVELDQDELHRWLGGRVLMVTGSCGSIGSEIARQLLRFEPAKLLLVDRSETGQFFLGQELASEVAAGRVEIVLADMTDRQRLEAVFDQYQPQVVFHAAAYKHVPLMEQHPGEAVKNIVGATRNLVDLARAHAVESFVMISTDKAVNPTSVMGCCKRVAELYVQAVAQHAGCRFVTVRFGNVLGSAGSVVPIFRQQIAEGGPVTVTHPEMTRYFMTIPEASQLVIQAGAIGQGGEIFVLDMGEPVRIMDLAEDMIRLSGLTKGIDIDVEFSGLRPGEKLYEELYTDDEQQRPTVHPKILTAESERVDLFTVNRHIERLLAAADQPLERSPQSVHALLHDCVPRYAVPQTDTRRAA